jgi:hypothetical protein
MDWAPGRLHRILESAMARTGTVHHIHLTEGGSVAPNGAATSSYKKRIDLDRVPAGDSLPRIPWMDFWRAGARLWRPLDDGTRGEPTPRSRRSKWFRMGEARLGVATRPEKKS